MSDSKIFILVGSHRQDSQSAKVGQFLQKQILSIFDKPLIKLLNLGTHPLPMWDENLVRQGSEMRDKHWTPVATELQEATSIVLVTPEYSGMVAPAVKNFLLLCGKELAHKPALLCSVSAGRGGAYPIAELRSSGYKNSMMCIVPDHLIFRDVGNILNADQPENEGDTFIRQRTEYTLNIFKEYDQAFQQLREGLNLDFKQFGNGM